MKRGFLKSKAASCSDPGTSAAQGNPVTVPRASEARLDTSRAAISDNHAAGLKRGFLNSKTMPSSDPRGSVVKDDTLLIPKAPGPPPHVPEMGDVEFVNDNIVNMNVANLHKTMCVFHAGTKQALLQVYPELTGPGNYNFGPTNFAVKNTPGQGRGIFATKALNVGDRICSERPIFVLPHFIPGSEISPPMSVLTCAVDALGQRTPDLYAAFFKLHNSKSNDPKDILGIIHTNSLSLGALPGPYVGEYAGVYDKLSLFNHSCTPNASYRWDLQRFSGDVFAVRPIAADEQITISYCPLFIPRAERQKTLSSKYAFKCACTSCALPDNLSARSDVKRKFVDTASTSFLKEYTTHEYDIRRWAADLTLPDDHIAKHVRLLMQVIEDEQVFDEHIWLAAAEVLCKVLCALKDKAGAIELAQKASGYSKILRRGDETGWNKVAAAPEKTVWWGMRNKTTG
ncbi:hypothetical protein H0H92_009386 [Tricholoma furcatifolium]|nr:hypothetical protein H0H92_009386 [Tricholoma furcatifolium]